MRACKTFRKHIQELAAFRADRLPPENQDHLTSCPNCRRTLAAARLSRQLLDAVATDVGSLADFPERVVAAVRVATARLRVEEEPWQLGWRVMPAFGTLTAVLLILYQLSVPPIPSGLFGSNGLTASERLVLEGPSARLDMVRQAMLEQDER